MEYKKLLQTFTEEDFTGCKINLHIHTAYSDGKADFNDIIKQAVNKGYRYISITDHNTMNGYIENDIPKNVIPGVEFDCWHGFVFLHLLAYGVDFNNKDLKMFFAKSKKETELDIIRIFTRRRAKRLIKTIHNAGGIAVIAHPACCWCLSMNRFIKDLIRCGLDGMEVYYPYERHRCIVKFHRCKTIEKIAEKYGLIKTGGSDLHEKILT